MTYNPFQKAVGQPLNPADLRSLVDRVAEGYYVEYKSEFPANRKISHSIASFANTNGGWYLVGVEADKQTNLAKSLPGVDLSEFRDPIAKVRDIARDRIGPMPLLFPQLVPLNGDRAILVVYVPESEDTPHVTGDGRVYRRAADRSDPVFETDRLALDRLVDRGRAAVMKFDGFCEDERAFFQSEAAHSWVELYLSPYPFGLVSEPDIIRSDYLDRLVEQSEQPLEIMLSSRVKATATGSFNHAHTCVGSAILRQVEPSDVAFSSLEVELFWNGRGRTFLPLYRLPMWPLTAGIESKRVSEVLDKLTDSDTESNLALLTLVDLKPTWRAIAYLVAFYLEWLKGLGWQGDLQAKLRLSNVWRCVPFVDLDGWAEHVEKRGLPACGRHSIMTPGEGRRPLLFKIDPAVGSPWLELFGLVAVSLGLPSDVAARFIAGTWGDSQQGIGQADT